MDRGSTVIEVTVIILAIMLGILALSLIAKAVAALIDMIVAEIE